jgi:DNA invertase Pin-like site-specific DNA recombinase
MRAAVYARYSSDRQRQESIEDQVRVCTRYCEDHGMTVDAVYADRAMSGRSDDRPEFLRMVDDADGFDAVVVYKMDRFSRDQYDAAVYKKRLADKGVKVLSATEAIPDSPEGVILEKLLEGMAAYYSMNLAQNVRRGMEGIALKGKYNGNPVWGYKVVDGEYRIDETQAPFVRQLFARVGAGESVASVAEDFARQGVTNTRGGKCKTAWLRKRLRDERYTGVYLWGDVRIEGGMPAIVSKAEFDAAVSSSRGRKHQDGYDYLLSGKLECSVCGERMVGVSGKGKGGRVYNYYRCSCGYVPAYKVHDAVCDATRHALEDKDLVGRIIDNMLEHVDDASATADAARARAAELRTKKANLLRALESGVFSESVVQRINEIDVEISRAMDFAAKEDAKREFDRESLEAFFATDWFRMDDALLCDAMVSQVVKTGDSLVAVMNWRGEKEEPAEVAAALDGFVQNPDGSPEVCVYELGCSLCAAIRL